MCLCADPFDVQHVIQANFPASARVLRVVCRYSRAHHENTTSFNTVCVWMTWLDRSFRNQFWKSLYTLNVMEICQCFSRTIYLLTKHCMVANQHRLILPNMCSCDSPDLKQLKIRCRELLNVILINIPTIWGLDEDRQDAQDQYRPCDVGILAVPFLH